MSKRDGDRRRSLSREDHALWKTFTKTIKPIRAPRLGRDDAENQPAPVTKPRAALAKSAPKPVPPREPPRPSAPPLARLDRRMKQRVSRGRQEIDGRLDLHGHYQDEAHAALLRFLRNASASDKKLVLVITGKGGRGGGHGVLRRQVPQWLNLPEFRAYVIGFEEAGVRHGGEGALYVRIRRARG